MANFFAQHRGALNLVKQVGPPNHGFRPGQLGAMHAVLAHESVHDDPAIICLPTGYGKTSLMMALPILLAAQRVLVVEPSDALRKQVSSHFRELSTLRRIGAISDEIPNPEVLRLEGRPRTSSTLSSSTRLITHLRKPGQLFWRISIMHASCSSPQHHSGEMDVSSLGN